MRAPNEFQLNQMYDVLTTRLASRKVNVRCLQREPVQTNVRDVWQLVRVRQGIETDLARRLVKMVKQTKLKVHVAIQGGEAPSLREEARRPAGSDRPTEGRRRRPPVAVQQLP